MASGFYDNPRRGLPVVGGAVWVFDAVAADVLTPQAAVEGADLIVTTAPSRSPLVRPDWVAPGAHMNAVGLTGADFTAVGALDASMGAMVADRALGFRAREGIVI